jgi:hypothetical protein
MHIFARVIPAMTAAFLMTGGFALAQNSPVGNTGRFESNSDCTRIADPTQRADCRRANGPMNAEPFKDRGGRAATNQGHSTRGSSGRDHGGASKGGSGAGGGSGRGGGGGHGGDGGGGKK